MQRRTFLAGAGLSLQAKTTKRPNVVFVLVDQWRAQALGHRGDPNARTPHLDALSRESFDFTNAVSGLPVCSPYRASLMTGQYAVRHGLVVNDVELKPQGETLGGAFRKAGYSTGYIGKWHIYGSPEGKAERRLTYIPESSRFGFDYWKVCECTHAYNRSLYYEGNDSTQRYWDGYDAIAQTRDACEFIRKRGAASDPYFMLLSAGPPHDPYGTAPEKYQALHRNLELKLRDNVPASHKEEALKNLGGYYSHIAALDDCVKQITDAIDATGKAEDTILVFTSDHGDMLQSQGLHHKQQPWDESIRVPMLIRYPRLLGRKRRTSITPIDVPDIMPTMLGLAGLPKVESAQGVDYSPLIRGKRKDDPEPAALLNLPASFSVVRRQGFAEYRGLRTPQHTFVRSIHGPWLLYDNLKDPYQKSNLIGKDNALQSRMERRLDSMLKNAGDEFLPGARYVERAKATHYREVNTPPGKVESPWGDWASTIKL
ncbi:MAG: sulfatase [Acidobacteria bacterium]|nr:sulfatase [Acidobacteriota bacterium]